MKLKARLFAKTFALVTAASMAFLPTANASAQTDYKANLDKYFPEDIKGHWAEKYLNDMKHSDNISGYLEDGVVKVKPDNRITRAEFVAILVNAMELQSDAPGKPFADVPANAWYKEYVRIASSLGIVSGIESDKFAPDQNIDRGQMATLIVKAFESSIVWEGTPKPFSDISGHWAIDYINKASGAGIINGKGDGTFAPSASATRAEAMTMLHKALRLEKSTLPDNSFLAQLALNHETEGYQVLKSNNFDELHTIAAKYDTGMVKSLSDWAADLYKTLAADGFTLDVIQHGEWTAKVAWNSDRYATVEMSGATYEIVISKDGEEVVRNQVGSANSVSIVHLKKMKDGSWKIYGMTPIIIPQ